MRTSHVSQKSRRKNWFLAGLGIVVLLLFGYAGFVKAPGHVSLLDANRTRLAETYREGWASGWTLIKTGAAGNARMAQEQRDLHSAHSDEYDPAAVLPAFCAGAIAAGFKGNLQADCLDVLRDLRLWPTYDGGLTRAWNNAFPYPLGAFGTAPPPDDSRTGPREEQLRRLGGEN